MVEKVLDAEGSRWWGEHEEFDEEIKNGKLNDLVPPDVVNGTLEGGAILKKEVLLKKMQEKRGMS